MLLKTNLPDHVRQSGSEEAVSVIHAPESFQTWVCYNHWPRHKDTSLAPRMDSLTDLRQKAIEPPKSVTPAERPADVISPPASEAST